MSDVKIIQGDNRITLPKLRAGSVHCIVTSPPYWGQRDYDGGEAEIGNEATPEQYIGQLVGVFRHARHVLRADGTLWLNLGDKYVDGEPLLLPARVALALRADGWRLRSEIIWHAPNKMPQSVKTRPSCNHEMIYLFSKGDSYYYDDVAIRERGVDTPNDRTKRSVWTINVGRETEKHFAGFPEALPRICILAGTSEAGCCSVCGMPWRRCVTRERVATRPGRDSKLTGDSKVDGNRDKGRHISKITTNGWETGCGCPITVENAPCIVLDPFGGTGTTGAVALKGGRRAILLELNPDYVAIMERKLTKTTRQRGFGLL